MRYWILEYDDGTKATVWTAGEFDRYIDQHGNPTFIYAMNTRPYVPPSRQRIKARKKKKAQARKKKVTKMEKKKTCPKTWRGLPVQSRRVRTGRNTWRRVCYVRLASGKKRMVRSR